MKLRIRELRESRGITQTHMAKKLEMSVSGYNSIDRGLCEPSMKKALIISRIFNISIEELFFEEELRKIAK